MTDPETDEQFEAFLKRRTLLPGRMPVDGKLEPPFALDEVVLNKARDAIKAQRQPGRAPRWAMPLALAATVLLCLSVVLNIRLNTNRPAADLERMTAASGGEAHQPAQTAVTSAPRNDDSRAASAAQRAASDLPVHDAILPETKVAGSSTPRPPVVAEPTGGVPPTAGALAANAAPTPASTAAGLSRAAVAHPRDPKAWLRQIEAMRARGKKSQADAEMRLFRATFPGYAAKSVAPTSSEPPK